MLTSRVAEVWTDERSRSLFARLRFAENFRGAAPAAVRSMASRRVARGRVTLLPLDNTPRSYRAIHDHPWDLGDFEPLDLKLRGQRRPVHHRGKRALPPPMARPPRPPRSPLFRQPWAPPHHVAAPRDRKLVQEHLLETTDPALSPWWVLHPTPGPKRSIGPLVVEVPATPSGWSDSVSPASPRADPLSPYQLRAFDARLRLALAHRATTPEFAEEMERVRSRLASAQESRSRPPTAVSVLMGRPIC